MKMNNFWKAASRKRKMFFLFSALILAAVIALLSVLFSSLLIRPEKIRLKSDVSAVFADERYEYYGETDGKIERADESGVKTFADLGSKILLLEKLGENLAVATEDRKITLFNENGGIEAHTAINYNPVAFSVSAGDLFVAGSTKVNRNKVYRFDENLNLLDLTPDTVHEPQGANESDLIYRERINALFLEIPVVAVGYDRESDLLTVLSSYGVINQYDGRGELHAALGLDYNPIAGKFLADGRLIVLDDAGGIGAFVGQLEKSFYLENLNSANRAMAVGADKIIVSDQNGRCTELDMQGNVVLRQTLKGKIEGVYLGADDGFSIWTQGSATVDRYDWSEMRFYTLYVVLAYVGIVLLLAALACTVIAALGLFSERRYRRVTVSLKSTGKRLYAGKIAYCLLLPTLLLCAIFAYYPSFRGLVLAFYEVDIGGVNTFVGWQNFIDLFSKTYFWSGMGNMVIFLVTDIVKGLIPAFLFAQLIIAMRSSRAQYVTRVLLYLPGIIPGVAALLMWQNGIFGNEGLLNGIITALGGQSVNFLGKEGVALPSLIFFGFPWIGSYIILYGALMGVPKSFYEAAKLDGCTWFKRMVMIDLPLVSPQLKYIFVITFIGSVQDFQRIYLTTEGAAGTYVPMLEMYYNLTKFNNLGMAAAMGLILFLVLMVATLINLKLKTVDSYE